MKRNRFTDEQIIGILKEHEAGTLVSELCRKHGVSDASIYKWKAKSGHSPRSHMLIDVRLTLQCHRKASNLFHQHPLY